MLLFTTMSLKTVSAHLDKIDRKNLNVENGKHSWLKR